MALCRAGMQVSDATSCARAWRVAYGDLQSRFDHLIESRERVANEFAGAVTGRR